VDGYPCQILFPFPALLMTFGKRAASMSDFLRIADIVMWAFVRCAECGCKSVGRSHYFLTAKRPYASNVRFPAPDRGIKVEDGQKLYAEDI